MKILFPIAGLVLAGTFLLARGTATESSRQDGETLPVLSTAPQLEAAEVVFAQPFELDRPGVHSARAERPEYRTGFLLVVAADRELLRLRQSAHPVLYVGDETARRVNHGLGSGHAIVIVPGLEDLASQRVFFGEAVLPEQVTKDEARRQLARSIAAGQEPLAGRLARIERAGTLFAQDEHELFLRAADLVERFAPDETDLVTSLRAPLLRRR